MKEKRMNSPCIGQDMIGGRQLTEEDKENNRLAVFGTIQERRAV